MQCLQQELHNWIVQYNFRNLSPDVVLARKLLYATCGACYMHLHFWYADIPSRILSYEASKDYKTILTSILNVKCCLTIVYIFCITCFCYKSFLKYKRQGIHLLSLLRPCGNRILERKNNHVSSVI